MAELLCQFSDREDPNAVMGSGTNPSKKRTYNVQMRSRTRRLLASVILLDALPAFLAVVNASCQFACDSLPIWTGFAILLQFTKFG